MKIVINNGVWCFLHKHLATNEDWIIASTRRVRASRAGGIWIHTSSDWSQRGDQDLHRVASTFNADVLGLMNNSGGGGSQREVSSTHVWIEGVLMCQYEGRKGYMVSYNRLDGLYFISRREDGRYDRYMVDRFTGLMHDHAVRDSWAHVTDTLSLREMPDHDLWLDDPAPEFWGNTGTRGRSLPLALISVVNPISRMSGTLKMLIANRSPLRIGTVRAEFNIVMPEFATAEEEFEWLKTTLAEAQPEPAAEAGPVLEPTPEAAPEVSVIDINVSHTDYAQGQVPASINAYGCGTFELTPALLRSIIEDNGGVISDILDHVMEQAEEYGRELDTELDYETLDTGDNEIRNLEYTDSNTEIDTPQGRIRQAIIDFCDRNDIDYED